MSILSVSYDLYRGQVYDELIAAIKKFSWCHVTESSWYVVADLTPEEMYQHLKPHLHDRDKIIISPIVKGSWWSHGLPDDVLRWLHAKLDLKQSA